jgi:hypothetical protein
MISGHGFVKKRISFITEFIIIFEMTASSARIYQAVGDFTKDVFWWYRIIMALK